MENFTAYNPVKLHFGNNVINNLGKTTASFGNNVLVVYGKGSIKKNGIYDKVIDQLRENQLNFIDFEGIKPNPIIQDVENAILLAKEKNSKIILAVGGGSVIDSAKIIALCSTGEYNVWEVMKGKQKPTSALPLIAVLTLAATGTEMNPYAVLQNNETNEKIGYGNPLIFPQHSFLDPNFTLSVPKHYTGYGIADLVAHSLEAYFGKGDTSLTDRFIFAIIKEAVEIGAELLLDLKNYELRERIMWASTCALNGITVYGKVSGDWGVHSIGHTISYLYDTPHGATLTVAYIAWLKLMKEELKTKILLLGKEVFKTTNTDETIHALESFFTSLGCPVRLSELNLQIGRAHV